MFRAFSEAIQIWGTWVTCGGLAHLLWQYLCTISVPGSHVGIVPLHFQYIITPLASAP